MFDQDYLTQRLVHLRPAEAWISRGQGFGFLFPEQGTGRYAGDHAIRDLWPGDVLVFAMSSRAKLSALDGGGLSFHYFSVCLEHLGALLAAREISLFQGVIDSLKAARLYPASGTLARECHKFLEGTPPQATLEHRSQLLRIVAAVL